MVDSGEIQALKQKQMFIVETKGDLRENGKIKHQSMSETNVIRNPISKVKVTPKALVGSKLKEFNLSANTTHQSKEVTTCDDLIYLQGPCTEAAIIHTLETRFANKQHQVFKISR